MAASLLAVDVGNTQTLLGLFEGAELAEHWRVATERHKSGNELGALYKSFLDLGRVEIWMGALFERAARLRRIDIVDPPTGSGKTTVARLQSGIVYGFAGQVDGIVERIRGELGTPARAIATGGLADLISPHASTI